MTFTQSVRRPTNSTVSHRVQNKRRRERGRMIKSKRFQRRWDKVQTTMCTQVTETKKANRLIKTCTVLILQMHHHPPVIMKGTLSSKISMQITSRMASHTEAKIILTTSMLILMLILTTVTR